MNIYGRKIVLLMAEQQLTFSGLAQRSGLSRAGLGKVLRRGECAPATAGKIAHGLGVSVEDVCSIGGCANGL